MEDKRSKDEQAAIQSGARRLHVCMYVCMHVCMYACVKLRAVLDAD